MTQSIAETTVSLASILVMFSQLVTGLLFILRQWACKPQLHFCIWQPFQKHVYSLMQPFCLQRNTTSNSAPYPYTSLVNFSKKTKFSPPSAHPPIEQISFCSEKIPCPTNLWALIADFELLQHHWELPLLQVLGQFVAQIPFVQHGLQDLPRMSVTRIRNDNTWVTNGPRKC